MEAIVIATVRRIQSRRAEILTWRNWRFSAHLGSSQDWFARGFASLVEDLESRWDEPRQWNNMPPDRAKEPRTDGDLAMMGVTVALWLLAAADSARSPDRHHGQAMASAGGSFIAAAMALQSALMAAEVEVEADRRHQLAGDFVLKKVCASGNGHLWGEAARWGHRYLTELVEEIILSGLKDLSKQGYIPGMLDILPHIERLLTMVAKDIAFDLQAGGCECWRFVARQQEESLDKCLRNHRVTGFPLGHERFPVLVQKAIWGYTGASVRAEAMRGSMLWRFTLGEEGFQAGNPAPTLIGLHGFFLVANILFFKCMQCGQEQPWPCAKVACQTSAEAAGWINRLHEAVIKQSRLVIPDLLFCDGCGCAFHCNPMDALQQRCPFCRKAMQRFASYYERRELYYCKNEPPHFRLARPNAPVCPVCQKDMRTRAITVWRQTRRIQFFQPLPANAS